MSNTRAGTDQGPGERSGAVVNWRISAPALLEALAEHAAKTLVFRYEGADVQAGYHVTEVKSGRFQALDCGAQYESWHETFIQLWDIPQENDLSRCKRACVVQCIV